jgi:flagellin
MSRINTNVSSLIAVNNLNKNQNALQTSIERLSTGTRINSGADDPAGLIASEGLLNESAATSTAVSNAQRADSIIGTADGALSEVSTLLTSLQSLVGDASNTAGLSSDEKDADQLQVDSILSTVNRISNSASFDGVKLLNGNFDYTTSGVSNATSAFTNVQINSANVGSSSLAVNVKVLTAATTGELDFAGSSTGLATSTTLSIAGNTGTVEVSFTSGTKSSAVVAGINQFTDSTGVKAVLSSDNKSVQLLSTGYGTNSFVSVSSTSASFSTTNTAGADTTSATGKNALLSVNGATATSDGLNVHVVNSNLDVNLTLNTAANVAGKSKSFGITGGGASFSLGAQVNSANVASIGLGTVNTASLGKTVINGTSYTLSDLGSGKAAAVNTGDTAIAQQIVNQAVTDVSDLRGRIGAFQKNVVGSTIDSLNVALENISSSESNIADTDFASETANLTRSQILVQSATSVLSTANSNPQNILKLLG